jgi:phospholipid/cholesterol/gamma-HCH transport system substrate-binding protein
MTVKLGNISLFGDNTYSLFGRFNKVTGLRVGNQVSMLGMDIGRIAGFSMD